MLEPEVLLLAGGIFLLRIVGVAVSTFRMLIMVRGRRVWSAVLGFFEALIFTVALASVVTQLDNVFNLAAYCGGFAVGTYIGMLLESRFITNFITVNIISAHHAHAIAAAVRESGFGATEAWGQGATGLVGSVNIVIRRQEFPEVLKLANEIDADAFITMHETRGIRHGYLRGPRPTT